MTTAASPKPADTLGITEAEQAPAAATPAANEKKAEESKVKTIQLSFEKANAEEMKLYDKIIKAAKDDDRKPPVHLMRYLKQHYGNKSE